MNPDFGLILPEIVLACGAMALLMLGAYRGGDRQASLINWLAAGLMAGVGLWLATSGGPEQVAFAGAFVSDGFARFAKVLILLSAALMLILGEDWFTRRGIMKFEFPVLVLLSAVGMLVMVSAGDLIALYMGLELQSLAAYVIASINRDSVRSTEAGLKYFVLGALSSGMLLYGASLVYGYTGTTLFLGIGTVVAAEGVSLGLTFGLVFLCAALAFKISAAPFHMWTPDVYEGSPTPVDRLLRHGAQGRRRRAVRARPLRRLRRGRAGLGAGAGLHRHRLDVPRLDRGHRAVEPQAAACLLVDRTYGLRARRARCRHARGRDLADDLPGRSIWS